MNRARPCKTCPRLTRYQFGVCQRCQLEQSIRKHQRMISALQKKLDELAWHERRANRERLARARRDMLRTMLPGSSPVAAAGVLEVE